MARAKRMTRAVRVRSGKTVAAITKAKDCRDVTAEDICKYLIELKKWGDGIAKCLRKIGKCGGGAGVPADPPPWPPK